MMNNLIVDQARAFCKGENAANMKITSGWSQAQHVGFQFTLLKAATTDNEMLEILTETVNPSAFRQSLEKLGILVKSESKVKTIANPWVEVAKA